MLQDHERKIIRLEAKVEFLEKDQLQLKDELRIYQAAAISANKKMDALLVAMVGDETMKTTGILQRVESIEVVANFVRELKWKAIGGLVVVGWAGAVMMWLLDKLFK